ncbi:type II toxin-antitoxin system RelE/ParE family toxin [Advenella mimigardefordensis]
MVAVGPGRSIGNCRLHFRRQSRRRAKLEDEIEIKVAKLPAHPRLYRVGRIEGTREIVVRTNYVVVYMENPFTLRILRVLHAAQQWPPAEE